MPVDPGHGAEGGRDDRWRGRHNRGRRAEGAGASRARRASGPAGMAARALGARPPDPASIGSGAHADEQEGGEREAPGAADVIRAAARATSAPGARPASRA